MAQLREFMQQPIEQIDRGFEINPGHNRNTTRLVSGTVNLRGNLASHLSLSW